MALTLSERTEIAEANGVFCRRVKGALVKHAKYVLRLPAPDLSHQTLASLVVNEPNAYVTRFAIALLTEPVNDNINSDAEITDGGVQDGVAELWQVFAPILTTEAAGGEV